MFAWIALLYLDYWILYISLGTVQNPISSDIPRCTPRLVSNTDYGFDQWSVVCFVIKNIFVHLFMVKECTCLVTQMYFMQIYFYFLWFENECIDFLCISEIFVDPAHKVKYKGKQNSEKIQNSIWRQSI